MNTENVINNIYPRTLKSVVDSMIRKMEESLAVDGGYLKIIILKRLEIKTATL